MTHRWHCRLSDLISLIFYFRTWWFHKTFWCSSELLIPLWFLSNLLAKITGDFKIIFFFERIIQDLEHLLFGWWLWPSIFNLWFESEHLICLVKWINALPVFHLLPMSLWKTLSLHLWISLASFDKSRLKSLLFLQAKSLIGINLLRSNDFVLIYITNIISPIIRKHVA